MDNWIYGGLIDKTAMISENKNCASGKNSWWPRHLLINVFTRNFIHLTAVKTKKRIHKEIKNRRNASK